MKIRRATHEDQIELLALMQESFEQELEATTEDWLKTKTAVTLLLNDSQAGEAYLALDDENHLLGYIIMCRGFSLDYGGYFTWVEETYMRKTDQRRFRDQRFSP
jgi:hypothetical protein